MNFLIGAPGNGLSTQIQNDFYSEDFENIKYLNYTNLPDVEEKEAFAEIISNILEICCENTEFKILEGEKYEKAFRKTLSHIKNHKKENSEGILIVDAFQYFWKFSNEFFFYLGKLLATRNFIPEVSLTSILISDIYINPTKRFEPRALYELFYIHMNINIIPGMTYEEVRDNPIQNFPNRFTNDEIKRKSSL